MELIEWSKTSEGNLKLIIKPSKPVYDLKDEEAVKIIRTISYLTENYLSTMLQDMYVTWVMKLKGCFSV